MRSLDRLSNTILSWIEEFVTQHYKSIFLFCVAGFVLAFCLTFLSHRSESELSLAKNAFFLAEKQLNAELKSSLKKNTVGESIETRFPALLKLKEVEQKYPKTRSAFEARIKIAYLHFQNEQYDESIPWYEKAVLTAPGSFEKTLALSGLAYSFENLKRFSDAAATFQKAIDLGESVFKADLLMGSARSHKALGNKEKSRFFYDQIMTEFPNTDHAKTAELQKNQL